MFTRPELLADDDVAAALDMGWGLGAVSAEYAVGAIDATVVETAIRQRAAVVTSDRSDIEQLAASAR